MVNNQCWTNVEACYVCKTLCLMKRPWVTPIHWNKKCFCTIKRFIFEEMTMVCWLYSTKTLTCGSTIYNHYITWYVRVTGKKCGRITWKQHWSSTKKKKNSFWIMTQIWKKIYIIWTICVLATKKSRRLAADCAQANKNCRLLEAGCAQATKNSRGLKSTLP